MTLFATAQFKMIHSSGGMATVAFAALPFYTTAILQEMHDNNVIAEVVTNSHSGGFTFKLTRRNISTGLNGTEIGCSRSTLIRSHVDHQEQIRISASH